MSKPLTFACIDLAAIRQNVAALKSRIPAKTYFMAVVKADGYGHGSVPAAQAAMSAGADWLGVARLEEAVVLRTAGIQKPILVFGYIFPQDLPIAADMDLTATAYHLEMAKTMSVAMADHDQKLKIHIKVDTGMGRVGMISWNNPEVIREIRDIHALPGLRARGLYTHFAAADTPENPHTVLQINRFSEIIQQMKNESIDPGICHAANSAGIIHFPDAHFDMVRAGIAMYGCDPANKNAQAHLPLAPAMAIKSCIAMVKTVPENFPVSYGMTYRTSTPTRLAAVPIGYADGFSRAFSSNGCMLVKGREVPIVGRVCMDQTMIDVGKIPDAAIGDEVVILGKQDRGHLSAETLANRIKTINYEITSGLTARVGKIYLNET